MSAQLVKDLHDCITGFSEEDLYPRYEHDGGPYVVFMSFELKTSGEHKLLEVLWKHGIDTTVAVPQPITSGDIAATARIIGQGQLPRIKDRVADEVYTALVRLELEARGLQGAVSQVLSNFTLEDAVKLLLTEGANRTFIREGADG